ncbi:hypothetical protein [Streptomyces nitrosporeus]|uniref:hypothetical protein n=1 Tax=Streptomyces nitrosporeus TaxID=28894 RepID=UPI00399FE06F
MTTESTAPVATTAPPWRTAQQQAMNVCWAVSGLLDAAPFCITQTSGAYPVGSTFSGDIHYAEAAPVHAIAAEYGVPVTETPSGTTDTCHVARVTVDGTDVRVWAIVYGTRTQDGAA